MAVHVVPLSDARNDVTAFVRFSETIYRDDAHWVPPLINEQIHYIRSGPFNRFGKKQLFMAYRGGEPVARLSVHQNFAYNTRYNTNQGFFGFFEAKQDPEAVRAVFEAGDIWLKDRGCRDILGPMSFSIYEEIGLLVDGFKDDPAIMCPYNPPYYADLLEGIGFRKEIDWYGYRFHRGHTIPPAMERVHRRVLERKGVVLRPVQAGTWEEDAAIIRRIFNEAWAANWGHVPFDEAHWRYVTKYLKLAVLRDLSWIVAADGEPVGFLIVVKDLNPALKQAEGRLFPLGLFRMLWHARRVKRIRIIIMGFLEPYRVRGYDMALAYEALSRALVQGYEACDCSQIVESNHRLVQALDMFGGERYRTFRIYRKPIQGATRGTV
jgi:hypothetical protein